MILKAVRRILKPPITMILKAVHMILKAVHKYIRIYLYTWNNGDSHRRKLGTAALFFLVIFHF